MAIPLPRHEIRLALRAMSRTKFNLEFLAIVDALNALEAQLETFTEHDRDTVTEELAAMGVHPADYSDHEFTHVVDPAEWCGDEAHGFLWALRSFKATAESYVMDVKDYGAEDIELAAEPFITTAKEASRG